MAGRKEYEMLFQLNAQLGGSYSKTFKAAQQEIVSMQKEIQALSKTQADISAFQKQQAAVEATRKRLEMLRQQYDNIQREMEETGNESADMKNKLLAKQLQIDKTSASLEKQTAKLNELSGALEEAGVNTDDLSHSSEQLSGKIDDLKKKQGEAADKAMTFGDKAGQAFNQVHEAIVAAGIAVALKEIYEYFASCAQASMDFESAITGVAKTTDLTDEELAAMSDSIKALSTEIPATTEEIAAVAEAAGQLGIQKDALLDFTEIMTMLGTATNMTADEAATALARFANITGMATDNYGRLGSVIVDLGNNFATTESEIVAMGTRLASAGKLAGLTEPEIMALAAAMSSVGIEAEAGGTAMTQTLNAIEKAVAKGGDDLAEFARIAGMSSEEFSSAWKNDAMSALTSFIGGLGKLDEQGESTVLVLEDLGLTGIRQSNMLKALGLAADQMTGAVNTANTAWQQNTALTNEANKRYATAQSRLTMMQNAYNNLKVAIGDAYTPALSEAYGVGTKVLNSITAGRCTLRSPAGRRRCCPTYRPEWWCRSYSFVGPPCGVDAGLLHDFKDALGELVSVLAQSFHRLGRCAAVDLKHDLQLHRSGAGACARLCRKRAVAMDGVQCLQQLRGKGDGLDLHALAHGGGLLGGHDLLAAVEVDQLSLIHI